LVHAATRCPSKQNISYYNLHFVTNRDKIKQLYACTEARDPRRPVGANPQTLANLLIVYEAKAIADIDDGKCGFPRNTETLLKSQGKLDDTGYKWLARDMRTAIDISAAYVSLVSNLLGYATGFCSCMSDVTAIKSALGLRDSPELLLGVGFPNSDISRLVHHDDHSVVFTTHDKQPISVEWVR
jgi:hypothetical protein